MVAALLDCMYSPMQRHRCALATDALTVVQH